MAKRTLQADPVQWLERLPCSITVCDRDYIILYLNEAAAKANAESGGKALVGKSLLDCHPPRAREKLRKVMASGRTHVFTTEREGVKRMVYEAHWRRGRRVGGMVEVSFELPRRTRNLVRG